MKNKDVLAMEKAKIVEKMNQAIKDDDAKAFSEAFTELGQKIEDNGAGQRDAGGAGCNNPGTERCTPADI